MESSVDDNTDDILSQLLGVVGVGAVVAYILKDKFKIKLNLRRQILVEVVVVDVVALKIKMDNKFNYKSNKLFREGAIIIIKLKINQ